jgi:hypothetical protein
MTLVTSKMKQAFEPPTPAKVADCKDVYCLLTVMGIGPAESVWLQHVFYIHGIRSVGDVRLLTSDDYDEMKIPHRLRNLIMDSLMNAQFSEACGGTSPCYIYTSHVIK